MLKNIEPIKEPSLNEIVRVLNELVENHNETVELLSKSV